MVGFYTACLTEAQYGTADLIMDTAKLLMPLICLGITEGVFRFGMDEEGDKRDVFTVGLLTVLGGCSLFAIVLPLLGLTDFRSYIWLIAAFVVCANLPYNITTPVLTACVESRCFESLTVLIQKEVAQRICAKPGTSDYGAFTLLMQYYTEPELLFTVPNTCFLPAPKVTSAVIHCPVRKSSPVDVVSESALWRAVRAGFALRRKTLVNSLQTGYLLPKEQLIQIVTDCGFDANIRGEKLSLQDYAKLANALDAAI